MGAFDLSALIFPDADQGRQPQHPVQLSKTHKLARGIVLVQNLRYRQATIDGQPNTLVGTAGAVGRGGVGVSYGAADSLACPVIPDSVKRTILIVAAAKGSGAGGSLGRMYDTRNAGLLGYSAWRDDGASQESFNRGWSSANGQWYWTAAPAGQLYALAIAYDGSSTSNVPTVVRSGKQQTISVNTNPAGTLNTVTDPFYLGNRKSDNARNWSGEEYLFIVWDRLLTLDEQIWVTENGNYNQLLEPLGGFDIALQAVFGSSGASADLAGNAVALASASGQLATVVPISGAAVDVVTAGGALSAAFPLAGVAAAVSSAAGNLVLGLALSGQAIAQALASGALRTAYPLAGSAAGRAAGNGALSISFALSGAAVIAASASAQLTVGGGASLAGNAQVNVSAGGALRTAIPLAGAAVITASANGAFGASAALAGAAVSVVSAAGSLRVSLALSGAAVAQAIAQGGLALQVPLVGSAVVQAVAAGQLSGGELQVRLPGGGSSPLIEPAGHRPSQPGMQRLASRSTCRPVVIGGRRR